MKMDNYLQKSLISQRNGYLLHFKSELGLSYQ